MALIRTLARFALVAHPVGVAAAGSGGAATPPALKVYNADAGSFHVTSTLVTGKTEAVVIDSGFTRADALRIAADVFDSGKALKAIFISNADPDFYFGAETLRQLFPHVPVLTTPAVRARIEAKMADKLAFWTPKMGANAPHHPVLPDAIAGTTLTVDGATIEMRGTRGVLSHRPYVWIPSLKAIVGNIAVFGNLHVWTADAASPDERRAWFDQLDDMEALRPVTVVPGHMAARTATDASSIAHTRDYLRRFDTERARAIDAAALIVAMKAAYPHAGLETALEIGAKVDKGEMTW